MYQEYILLITFARKTAFSVRETVCFFAIFEHSERHGGIFNSFDFYTTTPSPGTPPTNSQRTKQFLSRSHDLWLFLSEGEELLTMATA
jgi:hypothetical protein